MNSNQFEPVLGYSQKWLEFFSSLRLPVTTCLIIDTDELAKQILFSANQQFTGRWDIESSENQHWSLYFSQGLICGGSGIHPIRSWYRQLSRHCPQLAIEAAQGLQETYFWNYDFLAEQVQQEKFSSEQMTAVLEGYIMETLFDIIQQLERKNNPSELRLSQSQIPQDRMNSALVEIPTAQLWRQAVQFWEAWQREGLTDISPNLAPTILQPERLQQQTSSVSNNLTALMAGNQTFKDLDKLQQQTSDVFYQNLIALADGNWTLRDLAVKLNRSLLLLAKQLLPYRYQEVIGLVEIKDLSFEVESPAIPKVEPTAVSPPDSSVQGESTSPLIACIEDSQVDILIMNQVLTQAGYRFINIQNQANALLTLISHKPDLILLDLMMPLANGYEICAQIRRVQFFKNTPVIIVTGKDGVIDRARAKMVGSSGFLTKPINREKVLKAIQMHLSAPTPIGFPDKTTRDDSVPEKADSLLDNLKKLDGSEFINEFVQSSIQQNYS